MTVIKQQTFSYRLRLKKYYIKELKTLKIKTFLRIELIYTDGTS